MKIQLARRIPNTTAAQRLQRLRRAAREEGEAFAQRIHDQFGDRYDEPFTANESADDWVEHARGRSRRVYGREYPGLGDEELAEKLGLRSLLRNDDELHPIAEDLLSHFGRGAHQRNLEHQQAHDEYMEEQRREEEEREREEARSSNALDSEAPGRHAHSQYSFNAHGAPFKMTVYDQGHPDHDIHEFQFADSSDNFGRTGKHGPGGAREVFRKAGELMQEHVAKHRPHLFFAEGGSKSHDKLYKYLLPRTHIPGYSPFLVDGDKFVYARHDSIGDLEQHTQDHRLKLEPITPQKPLKLMADVDYDSTVEIPTWGSTCFDEARYDKKSGNLFLKFRKGHKTYVYPNQPWRRVVAMIHATSKGKFYWRNLK